MCHWPRHASATSISAATESWLEGRGGSLTALGARVGAVDTVRLCGKRPRMNSRSDEAVLSFDGVGCVGGGWGWLRRRLCCEAARGWGGVGCLQADGIRPLSTTTGRSPRVPGLSPRVSVPGTTRHGGSYCISLSLHDLHTIRVPSRSAPRCMTIDLAHYTELIGPRTVSPETSPGSVVSRGAYY